MIDWNLVRIQAGGEDLAWNELISKIRGKGRTIQFAEEDSEEFRYLNDMGADANVGGEALFDIILRIDARRIEVLEEFSRDAKEMGNSGESEY